MVSSAAQLILDEAVEKGCKLYDLADYAVIQINDTHPTMVIPEPVSYTHLWQGTLRSFGESTESPKHNKSLCLYWVS